MKKIWWVLIIIVLLIIISIFLFLNSEKGEEIKTLTKIVISGGPGQCKGIEECENYCKNNIQDCITWCEENPNPLCDKAFAQYS